MVAWGTSTNPDTYVANVDYGQSAVPPGLSNVVAIAAGGQLRILRVLREECVPAAYIRDYIVAMKAVDEYDDPGSELFCLRREKARSGKDRAQKQRPKYGDSATQGKPLSDSG